MLCVTIFSLLAVSIHIFYSCGNNSDNANLSSLTLSHGTLDPAFSKNITSYIAAVENTIESITVTPMAEHPYATIIINGMSVHSGQTSEVISLKLGGNSITIIVTAENSTEKTYTIALERLATYTKRANISVDLDWLNAMSIDDNYIYLVGYDSLSGDGQWHIQKRDKLSGETVPAFDNDGIIQIDPHASAQDKAHALAIDTEYMYITGYDQSGAGSQWRIEKRDIETGASVDTFDSDGVVESDPTTNYDEPYTIAIDANYIYIAGFAYSPSVGWTQWRVEKRDIETGALVNGFDSDGVIEEDCSLNRDEINSIAIDENYLYLAGYDEYSGYGNPRWRIEKRDIETGALVSGFDSDGIIIEQPNSNGAKAYSIAIDENYIYIAGSDSSPGNSQWRIEKRNIETGALVSGFDSDGVVQSNLSDSSEWARSIAIDDNYIYVAGVDYSVGNSQWRIEKRDIETGVLVSGFDSDGIIIENPSIGYDMLYSIAVDTFYIYLAGYDYEYGIPNSQWRLEKRYKVTGEF
jgi:hypothetical protein